MFRRSLATVLVFGSTSVTADDVIEFKTGQRIEGTLKQATALTITEAEKLFGGNK